MCESTVYLLKNGQEERFFENVETLKTENGTVCMEDLFGEEKRVHARVRSFSLVDHKIVLEALSE